MSIGPASAPALKSETKPGSSPTARSRCARPRLLAGEHAADTIRLLVNQKRLLLDDRVAQIPFRAAAGLLRIAAALDPPVDVRQQIFRSIDRQVYWWTCRQVDPPVDLPVV